MRIAVLLVSEWDRSNSSAVGVWISFSSFSEMELFNRG